jgi:hypothetical protein
VKTITRVGILSGSEGAGRLTGNFPGGTADLTWDFTITADKISRLVIAPERTR